MSNTKWLIPDITTSQDLSLAVLAYTTSIGRKFKLDEINIHFSIPITETITITRNSAKGANYDTVLRKRALSAEQDFVYRPGGDSDFQTGDELDIDITNANGVGVAYAKIKASELLR